MQDKTYWRDKIRASIEASRKQNAHAAGETQAHPDRQTYWTETLADPKHADQQDSEKWTAIHAPGHVYYVPWQPDTHWTEQNKLTAIAEVDAGRASPVHWPLHPFKQDIRLVHILPKNQTVAAGGEGELLEVRLREYSLERTRRDMTRLPQYEALSYTWGDALNRSEILVDGVPTKITRNLAVALQQLQYSDKERVVWCDALCINQLDMQERNRTVPRIHTIFAMARRVIAWLGEADEDSDLAFENIHRAARGPINKSFFGGTQDDGVRPDDIHHRRVAYWRAIARLFERGWWIRSWVVQEIQLARYCIVACGAKQMPFRLFVDACDFSFLTAARLLRKGLLPEEIGPGLMRMSSISHMKQPMFSDLADILTRFRAAHKATDPRDKVFAFLNLVYTNHMVEVDYTKPVIDVYLDAAKAIFQETKTLNLLALCEERIMSQVLDDHSNLNGDDTPDEPLSRLPSWAPDWLSPRVASPLFGGLDTSILQSLNPNLEPYSASGSEPVHANFFSEEQDNMQIHFLEVRGTIVGQIGAVMPILMNRIGDSSPTAAQYSDSDSFVVPSEYGAAYSSSLEQTDPNLTAQEEAEKWQKIEFLQAFAQFLHEVDVSPGELAVPILPGSPYDEMRARSQLSSDFQDHEIFRQRRHQVEFLPALLGSKNDDDDSDFASVPTDGSKAGRRGTLSQGDFQGRCFLQTTTTASSFGPRRAGIGPPATRPGDMLAVVCGCHVPLVLRDQGPVGDSVREGCSCDGHPEICATGGCEGSVCLCRAERCYTVVGEAYIQHIMYGEAVNPDRIWGSPINYLLLK